VVDLGTEFTMIADAGNSADVLVLKGEIEAAPRGNFEQDTILLREKESRRFASSGVSDVRDTERKFALFDQPLSLERFSPSINYVHWSFDENEGNTIKADFAGKPRPDFDASVISAGPAPLAVTRTPGPHAHALRFD